MAQRKADDEQSEPLKVLNKTQAAAETHTPGWNLPRALRSCPRHRQGSMRKHKLPWGSERTLWLLPPSRLPVLCPLLAATARAWDLSGMGTQHHLGTGAWHPLGTGAQHPLEMGAQHHSGMAGQHTASGPRGMHPTTIGGCGFCLLQHGTCWGTSLCPVSSQGAAQGRHGEGEDGGGSAPRCPRPTDSSNNNNYYYNI